MLKAILVTQRISATLSFTQSLIQVNVTHYLAIHSQWFVELGVDSVN
jgi:hypothetical protein